MQYKKINITTSDSDSPDAVKWQDYLRILFFFFFAVKGAFSQGGSGQTVQQKYDALFAGFGSNPTEKQIGRAYNEVLHFQNASLDKAIMLRQRLRYADDRTYQLFKTKDSLLVQLGRAYERPPQLRGDTRALEQNITEIENLILTRVQRSNRYYLALSEQFAHELYKNNPSPSCYICYLKIHFKKGHRKLADQLYVYSARKERTPLRWQQVRNELTDGEVSVEFVAFRDAASTDLQYAALLLRKGFASPQYVQLCTQNQLNEVLLKGTADDELYLQNLYSPIAGVEQPTLYELIWKPLLPFLKNTRKIYYAPAGDLHRINLAAISPGEGVPPLQDKFRFVLINSTRSLVNTYSEMAERLASLPDIKMPCFFGATVPNGFPARFFGNIELDYYGPDVDANNREAVLYGSINYDLDSLAIRAPIRENVYAPRSGRGDGKSHRRRNFIKGEDWEYLFGTKTEIESILALLQGSGYKVRVLEGNNATEESFKKLSASGVSPRVLHIATHGFFFSDTTSQDTEEQMNRSGLILAGANYAWKAGTPLSGREDGILSAFEISHTNLRSTELVVLSACETGLGYIVNNEGVFGLQRAFKQAGVKNLLVSLWSIPDNATQVLMTEFYRNCLERNMPMPEALKSAQKWMRNQQGYENPYFWAGFVLLE